MSKSTAAFLMCLYLQPVAAYFSLDNYCSAQPLIAIGSSGVVPGAAQCIFLLELFSVFIASRHQCSAEKAHLCSLKLFGNESGLLDLVSVAKMLSVIAPRYASSRPTCPQISITALLSGLLF